MPFVFILLLAGVLRLLWLDLFPTSITGDELTYILSAKSFLLTGTDLSGTLSWWQVLLFHYPPMILPQAELPYFLLLPFVSGDFSFFLIRLPFALFGVFIVAIIYFISKELWNRQVGLFAAFFTAISPWFIFINRTAYEMTPAVVFYLLGFLILLKTKGWKIFFAFPVFVLAFYAYIATKLVFLPFILLTLSYLFFVHNKGKNAKPYTIFALLAVGFTLLFVVLLQQNDNSRIGDMLFPNSSIVSEQVDSLRRNSLEMPFMNIFVNKITVYLWILLGHLFAIFSGSYLFTAGDGFYGMWRHGLFYTLDALFLMFGLFFLAKKERARFFFFISVIAIGLLPQIIHKGNDNFTPHITFIFPFVFMVLAYGVVAFVDMWKTYRKFIVAGVVGSYIFLLCNFVFIYFFQYPLQGQSDFPTRVLSRYVALSREHDDAVIIYSQRSSDLLRKYIFYNSLYTQGTVNAFQSQLTVREPTFDRVSFKSCDETIDPSVINAVVLVASTCSGFAKNTDHLTLAQALDSGSVYEIYNDKICQQYPLNSYISGLTVFDFAVEKLSVQMFCQKFILSQ